MSARAEYFRQLARKCAAAADAAADPVTKAKFEQEQHQWLLRAEQALKTERNLMTRPSREGRLRKPALPPVGEEKLQGNVLRRLRWRMEPAIPQRIRQSERTEILMLLSRPDALLAKPLY
jgi:hypothetical protein